MQSDFLVDGQVSGLGTVHPLLALSFVSTWIFPLHVVSSTLKRKSSSSVMDGLQRRYYEINKLCVNEPSEGMTTNIICKTHYANKKH